MIQFLGSLLASKLGGSSGKNMAGSAMQGNNSAPAEEEQPQPPRQSPWQPHLFNQPQQQQPFSLTRGQYSLGDTQQTQQPFSLTRGQYSLGGQRQNWSPYYLTRGQ